jgi:hypothetical protein
MKFSWAISQVRWFSFLETSVLKVIAVLVLRVNSTTLRTRTEMVFEMLVFKKMNHLTWLIVRENFIILTHRESIKLYKEKVISD